MSVPNEKAVTDSAVSPIEFEPEEVSFMSEEEEERREEAKQMREEDEYRHWRQQQFFIATGRYLP